LNPAFATGDCSVRAGAFVPGVFVRARVPFSLYFTFTVLVSVCANTDYQLASFSKVRGARGTSRELEPSAQSKGASTYFFLLLRSFPSLLPPKTLVRGEIRVYVKVPEPSAGKKGSHTLIAAGPCTHDRVV
jgi:hypothetical protein